MKESIKSIRQKLNFKKPKHIVSFLNDKNRTLESSVKLYDETIARVSRCKHIGIIPTDDMRNATDS